MKRILIEGMSRMMGGLETFILTLYRNISHEEYHFDFITYDPHVPFEEDLLQAGSRIYRITPRSVNYMKYKSGLDKVFKEGNYDIFWSNRTTLSSIRPFQSAMKYGVPIIVCHSHQSKNMGTFFTLCMHTMNKRRVRKYITKKAACSDVAAKWFFGNDKDVVILNNSVDTEAYDYDEEKSKRLKSEFGLENMFVVGHIGRFAPEKNHVFLIKIFEKILKKERDAVLLLCGDGDKRKETEELVKVKELQDRVKFLGIRNDIIDLLHVFDVMIFPSLFEGLPFVLVEAQATGLPCFVSDGVSRQAKLTDVLEFIPLDEGADYWADVIIKHRDEERGSKRKQMEKSGFSISNLIQQIDTYILQ